MRILSFSLLVFLLGACSFQQEVTFNKNLSGTMTGALDMSMTRSMGGEDGEPMGPLIDDEVKEKIERLKQIKGIKNVVFSETAEGLVNFSYEFSDLIALNASTFMFYQDPDGKTVDMFKKTGKKTLTFELPDMSSPEGTEDELGDMGSMFTYDLILRFNKAIKIKTKSKAVLSEDKKGLTLPMNLSEISKPGFESRIEISL